MCFSEGATLISPVRRIEFDSILGALVTSAGTLAASGPETSVASRWIDIRGWPGICRVVFREGATWNSPVILATTLPGFPSATGLGTAELSTTGLKTTGLCTTGLETRGLCTAGLWTSGDGIAAEVGVFATSSCAVSTTTDGWAGTARMVDCVRRSRGWMTPLVCVPVMTTVGTGETPGP